MVAALTKHPLVMRKNETRFSASDDKGTGRV